MKLILVGYMGSGKSSIGKRLANRLEFDFIDLDNKIEIFSNATIEDIFEKNGEEEFRSLETYVLSRVLQGDNMVLATGGGTPCHSNNMEVLKENGFVVYLELTPETLKKRLFWAKTKRPIIKGMNEDDLLEFIEVHLENRREFYEEAHFIVDADKINAKLLDEIKERTLEFQ